MKTLEELKKEQFDAKAKLHELVEFINSEDFYTLSQSEKSIIGQRRMALEIYLNSYTRQIYDKEGSAFDMSSTMWLPLLTSMFSTPWSSSGTSFPSISENTEELTEENKDIFNIPMS